MTLDEAIKHAEEVATEEDKARSGNQNNMDWNEMDNAAKSTKDDWREYKNGIARQSQKRRREFARKIGMCSICCKNKPEAGYMTCRHCRDIAIRANRRKKERK